MSGPDYLDHGKLSEALKRQGIPLEADAFFACRRYGWKTFHGYRYGDNPERREIDVFGNKAIPFDDSGQSKKLTGTAFIFVECKYATSWWVFTNLSGSMPAYDEYLFASSGSGLGAGVVARVVEVVVGELPKDVRPSRAWSGREVPYSYEQGRQQRQQFYEASLQALSAMRGHGPFPMTGLSLGNPILRVFAPVVLTNRQPVVAHAAEGKEDFDFEETDWVIFGSEPDIVHVVTSTGLDQFLTFYDKTIEALNSPGARNLIWALFKS